MKKLLAVLGVMIIGAFCLVGCGTDMSDSPYVGTWNATTASYAGIEMGVSDIMGGDVVLTLEDNGKCNLDVAGDGYSGKWAETDEGFIIDEEMEVTVADGVATMDYEGVLLYFEQQ